MIRASAALMMMVELPSGKESSAPLAPLQLALRTLSERLPVPRLSAAALLATVHLSAGQMFSDLLKLILLRSSLQELLERILALRLSTVLQVLAA